MHTTTTIGPLYNQHLHLAPRNRINQKIFPYKICVYISLLKVYLFHYSCQKAYPVLFAKLFFFLFSFMNFSFKNHCLPPPSFFCPLNFFLAFSRLISVVQTCLGIFCLFLISNLFLSLYFILKFFGKQHMCRFCFYPF